MINISINTDNSQPSLQRLNNYVAYMLTFLFAFCLILLAFAIQQILIAREGKAKNEKLVQDIVELQRNATFANLKILELEHVNSQLRTILQKKKTTKTKKNAANQKATVVDKCSRSLALNHRQGQLKIIVFVGSPIVGDEAELVKLAKRLKEENLNVDIVSFDDYRGRNELLTSFITEAPTSVFVVGGEIINLKTSLHYNVALQINGWKTSHLYLYENNLFERKINLFLVKRRHDLQASLHLTRKPQMMDKIL